MRISAVIPMYNASRTIAATIQSCLQQTLPPFEIIVVNDCSSDNCASIVEEQFGTQVRLITLPKNSGPSHARNAGWEAAQGDYVAFLDSDDVWHKNKLELCAVALQNNKDAALLWHHFTHEKSNIIFENPRPVLKRTYFKQLLIGNTISTSCVVFKRDIPFRFNENMRYCEDYDLALRLSYAAKVYELPLVLTTIDRPVLSPGGLSSSKWKMRRGEMKAYFNLGTLHPLFYLLTPVLHLWSLAKHFKGALRVP